MKYLLAVLLFIGVAYSSCTSNKAPFNAAQQAKADDNAIQKYISTNHINAIKNASGLYYQIIRQGTGANATGSSTVQVKYKGALLDGSVFDQTTEGPRSFPLNGVIPGWTIGIPLVKAGGSIKLFIPSALGYGESSPGAGIPENSILVFTIDVLSVK